MHVNRIKYIPKNAKNKYIPNLAGRLPLREDFPRELLPEVGLLAGPDLSPLLGFDKGAKLDVFLTPEMLYWASVCDSIGENTLWCDCTSG